MTKKHTYGASVFGLPELSKELLYGRHVGSGDTLGGWPAPNNGQTESPLGPAWIWLRLILQEVTGLGSWIYPYFQDAILADEGLLGFFYS